jgi:hypothetical protein
VLAKQATLPNLSPFALVIFEIGSRVYAQAGLDHNPPIYASRIAEMTSMHHHAAHFIG